MVPRETVDSRAAGEDPRRTSSAEYEESLIRVPCKPEYAMVVRLLASGLASHRGFTHDEIENIKIAIGEACTNCIQHAYPPEQDTGDILVRFFVYPSKLVIIVEDSGIGFDVKLVEEFVQRAEREKGKKLGIFLMKSLLDELEITSVSGEGTQVRMVKHREGQDESIT